MKTKRNMHAGASAQIFHYAIKLRKNPTESEKLLWNKLRNRQLEGIKFRRQHPFDDFAIDFYSHELELAIELDGGYHETKRQKFSDDCKDIQLMSFGLTVLRYTNENIFHSMDIVLEDIREYIKYLSKIKEYYKN